MGLVDGSTTLQLRLALEGLDRVKPVYGGNLLFQDNLHTQTAHRSGLCALEWLVIWSAKSCKVRAQGDADGWLTAPFFLCCCSALVQIVITPCRSSVLAFG